jgi:hypothetical protein
MTLQLPFPAPGRSSVAVTGVSLGGPEQHRNMSDWNNVSVELLRRTQLINFYSGNIMHNATHLYSATIFF